jgi:hypothetical protein
VPSLNTITGTVPPPVDIFFSPIFPIFAIR